MKEPVMSKVVAPVVSSTIVMNAQVEQFVNQYRLCVKKTATAILELACVVGTAANELSKPNFMLFREQIGADKSKDSYIKKLRRTADCSARLNSVSDKLPPSYTTLYTLSQLSDEVFTQVCEDDVISPRMTALALSPYVNKKSTTTDLDVTLSFKNVSDSDKFAALKEIQDICKKFKIELKTKIESASTPTIKKLADLNANEIVDVTPKSELLAA